MFTKLHKIGVLTGTLLFTLAGISLGETDIASQASESGEMHTAKIGYRGLSTHGSPNRAREYDALEASPTLDFSFRGSQNDNDMTADVRFLSDRDYYFEGDLNHKALFRLHLHNERFVHNLDHIPYDQATEPEARPNATFQGDNPFPFTRIDYEDSDPGRDYGIRLDLYEAAVRGKLPTYPAHLNLRYWRWEKTGKKQLRYVNESCATNCHQQSRTRPVDRVTEEFSGSLDAHLGWVDLVFEQVYRIFKDREDIPLDNFESHFMRATGDYQHDEDPDSEFIQSTLKANTSLGGGFVANASLSIGQRKNESDLFDVVPVQSETDFTKLASDVTYTPSQHWTWNFRYRMLELDNSNSSEIGGDGYIVPFAGIPRTFEVRDNMDIDRNFYQASLTYRPTMKYTLKGNYHREEIERSNTDGPSPHSGFDNVIDPYWELPGRETIQKFRLSYWSRHMEKNALNLQAWWEYQTSDDPAYNISLEDSQTVFLSAAYHPSALWGGIASLRLQEASNADHEHSQFDDDTPVFFEQDRDESRQNVSLGLWYNPAAGVNLDLNYGYLRSRIVEDLLFGAEPPDYTFLDDDVEYRQSVHTLSAGISWTPLESLSCRVEGYHIRSEATYSPNFASETFTYIFGPFTPTGVASSADLREISQIDIRQNGLKGRLTWQVDEHWTAGLEATFDDYDDHTSDVFDGSVQTYMASISRSW